VRFDREDVLALVKKSFDGFKVKALADYNPEVQARYKRTKKVSRRRQRQSNTYDKRHRAIAEYKERNGGRDPTEAIHPDFVSEYASGPETDGEETYEDWKVRMGKELGMEKDKMEANAWMRTKYAERIAPRWRSDEVSPNTRICIIAHRYLSLQQSITIFKALQTKTLHQQSVRD
jgi:hypothetical protein